MELYETKQYYLTSSAGIPNNGTMKSDLTFHINKFIEKRDMILYNTIRISHSEIPYSFYIVNQYNNTFKFNNNLITLPLGNYNGFTLSNAINSQIQTIDASANLELDQTTGKYTLSSVSSFTLDVTSSLIYKILGLENSTYTGIFSGSHFELVFTFPLNVLGTKSLFIKLNNIILDNLNLATLDKATLKSIPVNVPPFGIIMYNNTENIETLVKNGETDYIHLQICDDDNNLVDFNNVDWNICLEIKSKLSMIKTNYNELFSSN